MNFTLHVSTMLPRPISHMVLQSCILSNVPFLCFPSWYQHPIRFDAKYINVDHKIDHNTLLILLFLCSKWQIEMFWVKTFDSQLDYWTYHSPIYISSGFGVRTKWHWTGACNWTCFCKFGTFVLCRSVANRSINFRELVSIFDSFHFAHE